MAVAGPSACRRVTRDQAETEDPRQAEAVVHQQPKTEAVPAAQRRWEPVAPAVGAPLEPEGRMDPEEQSLDPEGQAAAAGPAERSEPVVHKALAAHRQAAGHRAQAARNASPTHRLA